MGRLGSGGPPRNHSQDLHRHLAHALPVFQGETLVSPFHFRAQEDLQYGRGRSTNLSGWRKPSVGEWVSPAQVWCSWSPARHT